MSAKYKTNPNDPVNNPLTGENSLTKKEHFALEIGKSYIQGISTRKPSL